MIKKVTVCFGELLLRLSPQKDETLLQSSQLDMFVGGAEANVAVNLACLGVTTKMVSTVSNNNLGEFVLRELRKNSVDTSAINQADGRLGQYIFEYGANHRQGQVIYDRQYSVFSNANSEDYCWPEIFKSASSLHLSGINLALGEKVIESTMQAIQCAKKQNLSISFDGNFRPTLWKGREQLAKTLFIDTIKQVEIAFLTDKDIALITGLEFNQNQPPEKAQAAFKAAFAKFENLKWICATSKIPNKAGMNYQGFLASRDSFYQSREYQISSVIDPIGSGDAFAAGMLFKLRNDSSAQQSVDFAAAMAVAKHSIKGDFALTNQQQIQAVMDDSWNSINR